MPVAKLQVPALLRTPKALSISATMLPSDVLIQYNTGSGNLTYTLLSPALAPNRSIQIGKISPDTNVLTIAGTIAGFSANVPLVLVGPNEVVCLYHDATSWYVGLGV